MSYPGVYVEEVPTKPRSIDGVATSIAAFIGQFASGPVCEPKRIAGVSELRQQFGVKGRVTQAECAVQQFFENGGAEAWVVRAKTGSSREESLPDANDLIDALAALDRVELFNLLCVPDTSQLEAGRAAVVAAAATSCCEKRRAFYLLDVPNFPDNPIDTVAAMQRWLQANAALRNPNVAVYFPRPVVADPFEPGRLLPVPASGSVAGLYARTDGQRGIWKAPAGVEAQLKGVHALEVVINDQENGLLNPAGVNCLRHFPDRGIVSWGARTFSGSDDLASEWKYVPVRRTALFLEESLYRSTQWAVFEPNNERLWAELRRIIGNFLMARFRQGAFQGAKPEQAFYVRCGAETTSQNDRILGIVNIEVGFAPLKPAEFVVIKIQQKAKRP